MNRPDPLTLWGYTQVWYTYQTPPPGTPGPLTVMRLHLDGDPPGQFLFAVCSRSMVAEHARLGGCEVADLGPGALLAVQVAEQARGALPDEDGFGYVWIVGRAQDGRWLKWVPGLPAEPVPGTPGAAGARN